MHDEMQSTDVDRLLDAAGIPKDRKPGDPSPAQIRHLAWLLNRVESDPYDLPRATRLRNAWRAGESAVNKMIVDERQAQADDGLSFDYEIPARPVE